MQRGRCVSGNHRIRPSSQSIRPYFLNRSLTSSYLGSRCFISIHLSCSAPYRCSLDGRWVGKGDGCDRPRTAAELHCRGGVVPKGRRPRIRHRQVSQQSVSQSVGRSGYYQTTHSFTNSFARSFTPHSPTTFTNWRLGVGDARVS